ncbi:MAG: cbb3-type cytochrome oxidase assembly protein CcoS [Deltaproteobacteria bacterium]|nr:cbb3-type cytochrome oxidase assembly protein CcoS [Deltaproteobacteria bacterium]
MNIIYLLVPLALALSFAFVTLFVWCTANGQYEDLETPAYRILLEDEK